MNRHAQRQLDRLRVPPDLGDVDRMLREMAKMDGYDARHITPMEDSTDEEGQAQAMQVVRTRMGSEERWMALGSDRHHAEPNHDQEVRPSILHRFLLALAYAAIVTALTVAAWEYGRWVTEGGVRRLIGGEQ